jgi:hypothetical protein
VDFTSATSMVDDIGIEFVGIAEIAKSLR